MKILPVFYHKIFEMFLSKNLLFLTKTKLKTTWLITPQITILFTRPINFTLFIRITCRLRVLLIALKEKMSARLVKIFSDTLLLIFSTQMNN